MPIYRDIYSQNALKKLPLIVWFYQNYFAHLDNYRLFCYNYIRYTNTE